MKKIILFTLLIFVISCGQTNDEKAENAMVSAENFLTNGDCDGALTKINSIDARPRDARYVKLRATAYACKAGYTTTEFFLDDLTNINVGAEFLSSLATFSSAQEMDSADDRDYANIYTAINTLLFSGNVGSSDNPSASLRIDDFNTQEAEEINSLLMYLLMVELGKYFYYYGNTDSTGVKGGGTGSNDCLFSYTDGTLGNVTNIDTVLAVSGGACNTSGLTGHPDLTDGTNNIDVDRACEGIVLFNNFRDVIANITLGSITDVDLSGLSTAIDTFFTFLLSDITDTTLATVRNLDTCKADFATNTDDLEIYFAYVFETLHSKN